ncbi:MAG: hypothetical protein RLZZ347_337 [Candidatus Parcubacteria bacterium]|jgi:prepilin-type N-terminal cleavage/methylation domain-containing protein
MIFVYQSRGFTLVELLVVISVMSFLASIVLTSVGAARGKGADATIKQTMNSMRAQASITYNNIGNFNAVCGTNGVTQDSLIAQAIAQVTTLNAVGTCSGGATDWAFAAPLKGGGYWCVDSTNAGRNKTAGGVLYNALSGTAPAALSGTACN